MNARIFLVSAVLAGCGGPGPGDAEGFDVPMRDAPLADVPGLDAPALDAPALDAPTPSGRCAGSHTAPSLAGVTLERVTGVPIRDGFAPGWGIVEGPVWSGGALFVSHFGPGPTPAGRIYRIDGDAVTVALADAGTNGLALGPDGRIHAGSFALGGVVRFASGAPTSAPTPLVSSYDGMRLNGPNDLVVRSDGSVYFTDPDYQAPSPAPQRRTRVYRLATDGALSVITEDLGEPNGIALSLDERWLFVGHTGGLSRFPLDADGAPAGPAESFGDLRGNVDGLGRDCAGDLYVTNSNAVVVLDPSGNELGRLPARDATNVAFGGADGRTLFVTALGDPPALYRATLSVAGLPD